MSSEMELDELDKRIIKILQENARVGVRELARRLNVSPASISRRIRRLEDKGIIKGYTVITDDLILGRLCSLMLLISADANSDPDELCCKISELPETCLCLRTTGRYDIVALVECKDPQHVNELLRKVRKLGGISSLDTSLIIKTHKMLRIAFEDEIRNMERNIEEGEEDNRDSR